jgi:hypothetical protein
VKAAGLAAWNVVAAAAEDMWDKAVAKGLSIWDDLKQKALDWVNWADEKLSDLFGKEKRQSWIDFLKKAFEEFINWLGDKLSDMVADRFNKMFDRLKIPALEKAGQRFENHVQDVLNAAPNALAKGRTALRYGPGALQGTGQVTPGEVTCNSHRAGAYRAPRYAWTAAGSIWCAARPQALEERVFTMSSLVYRVAGVKFWRLPRASSTAGAHPFH